MEQDKRKRHNPMAPAEEGWLLPYNQSSCSIGIEKERMALGQTLWLHTGSTHSAQVISSQALGREMGLPFLSMLTANVETTAELLSSEMDEPNPKMMKGQLCPSLHKAYKAYKAILVCITKY